MKQTNNSYNYYSHSYSKINTLTMSDSSSSNTTSTRALYIDKCSIEPMIPIYLIVAGAIHLVGSVLLPLKFVFVKLMYAIEGILGIFSLCWFIAGSVWVFRIYQVSSRACDDTVYYFAFGILICEYVILCLTVFLICCACCLGLRSAHSTEAAHLIST
ncbi:transmembrane protein 272-like isoform X2 [Aquarana catesbeiana]|uniref:transmembrane protein 272-like isoform X2 n=1 Tax=Aquarana catesbeiana TaxID=8400 RepID=UPI003CCA095C